MVRPKHSALSCRVLVPVRYVLRLCAVLGLLLGACGEDPTVDPPQDRCGGRCFPGLETCDPVSGACVPVAGDAGDDTDVGDDVAGDGVDVTPDRATDGAVEDADLRPDRPENDGDHDSELDLPGDLDEDAGEQADAEVEDRGAEDLPGESDMAAALCPDPLEAHGDEVDNDRWSRAVDLHDTVLLAQLGGCSGVAVEAECRAYCAADEPVCSSLTRAACDCCECQIAPDLALCGTADADNYQFTLLKGDPATILVFAEGAGPDDFSVMVWQPPNDHPPEQLLPPSDGFMEGVWQSGDAPHMAVTIDAAVPREGADGVLAEYVLTIISDTLESTTIAYEIVIEVAPDSRGCLADSWDTEWVTYATEAASELRCEQASCQVELSVAFPQPVPGTICPWDEQDIFRHIVPVIEAPAERRIWIGFDPLVSRLGATLYLENADTGDLAEIDEICPAAEEETLKCADANGINRTLSDLEAGTYQLRVHGPDEVVSTQFDVMFFEPDD